MDVEALPFGTQVQAASDALYDLNSQLLRLKRLLKRQTSQGPPDQLLRELAAATESSGHTNNLIQQLTTWPDAELNSTQRRQRGDISGEFARLLGQIHTIQDTVRSSAQTGNSRTYDDANAPAETTPLLQVQTQVLDRLDNGELDLHVDMAADREHEIAQVQRGMREINAIFRDIGVLVAEQGQQLDTVEDNIAGLAQHTEDASRQLIKADEHQRRRGRWSCVALFVLLVLTILVGVSVLA